MQYWSRRRHEAQVTPGPRTANPFSASQRVGWSPDSLALPDGEGWSRRFNDDPAMVLKAVYRTRIINDQGEQEFVTLYRQTISEKELKRMRRQLRQAQKALRPQASRLRRVQILTVHYTQKGEPMNLEARNDSRGWVELPDCPADVRKSILETRSRIVAGTLKPARRSVKTAKPAVSTTDTVTAQEREAAHRRVQAAIIANLR